MVCMPLKSRGFWTRKKAHLLVIGMISFSFIYNIPRWIEFHTFSIIDPKDNLTIYKMETTDLRKDPQYKLYYIFWAYLFVMNIIPFTVLSYFNLAIWHAVSFLKNIFLIKIPNKSI